MSRARGMTLDLLRTKYRGALARAATCPTPIDLSDSLTLIYVGPDGIEQEISEGHFLDDAKCSSGTYQVELRAPAGFGFTGVAAMGDPTGAPNALGGGPDFSRQTSQFISSLLHEGRNAVEVAGQDLSSARARIRELEELTVSLMRRVGELERGSSGGDDSTQRELVQLLTRIASMYFGLGGQRWTAETVGDALTILQLVQRSAAVQEAIRTEGAGEPLRRLLGGVS